MPPCRPAESLNFSQKHPIAAPSNTLRSTIIYRTSIRSVAYRITTYTIRCSRMGYRSPVICIRACRQSTEELEKYRGAMALPGTVFTNEKSLVSASNFMYHTCACTLSRVPPCGIPSTGASFRVKAAARLGSPLASSLTR